MQNLTMTAYTHPHPRKEVDFKKSKMFCHITIIIYHTDILKKPKYTSNNLDLQKSLCGYFVCTKYNKETCLYITKPNAKS